MMKMKFVIAVLALCLVTSCAKKESVIVLIADPDGAVGSIELTNEKGSMTLDQAGTALYVEDDRSLPQAPARLSEAEIEQSFAQALAVQPLPPVRFILYFQHNSDELTREAEEELLPRVLATIKERESLDISVTGHTDRAGEFDYNLALSIKRAEHVRDLLVAAGVEPENIGTTSHGEGNPLIPTADNVHEPRNRRVEVIIR